MDSVTPFEWGKDQDLVMFLIIIRFFIASGAHTVLLAPGCLMRSPGADKGPLKRP